MSEHNQRSPNPLRFGKVKLDLERRILVRGGRVQRLSQEYWNGLVMLVEKRPNTVSRDELRLALGKSTDETLRKQIGLIRKALGDNAQPHKFIQSERNLGYRFIALPDKTAAEPERPATSSTGGLEAQLTRWGPVDGKPAGICINSCTAGIFIPWPELKSEIEERLLPQAVRAVPAGSTIVLGEFRGRKDWLVQIVNPDGKIVGCVWFGPDPGKKWAWDGLVRLGDAPNDHTAVVWQVYQRYSDSSYRILNTLDLPQIPEPTAPTLAQLTRWGPVDGKPAGICIDSCSTGILIPWNELKGEIEEKLLNQAGRVIPHRCTVTLDDFHGKRDWLVRIIDPEGKAIGYVWFGPDPDKKWEWDGLVRLGDAPNDYTAVVWQVYQRYSDSSYRRIAAYL